MACLAGHKYKYPHPSSQENSMQNMLFEDVNQNKLSGTLVKSELDDKDFFAQWCAEFPGVVTPYLNCMHEALQKQAYFFGRQY